MSNTNKNTDNLSKDLVLRSVSTDYSSSETADHGFKFQTEILFYLCLQIYQIGCTDFSFAFEVTDIDKLDDTVIECELNEEKFAFFLQAKHNVTEDEVYLNNFFAPTKEGGSKKFWKKYNLRQFAEALMKTKVQESLEKYEDHTQRYVIVTNNHVSTKEIVLAGKKQKVKPVETIVEYCEEFNEIFKKFKENGATVVKFGTAFKDQMEEIIDVIMNMKENVDKERLDAMDFLDKIVVLSGVPNYNLLEGLCDKFVKSIFEDNYSDLLPRFLRQNVLDFIKPVNKRRKFLNKKNFEEIVNISMQEVELTRMTETFIQSVKFFVKFDKTILERFRQDLLQHKVIELSGNEKISVLKIYDALKSSEVKVFLLQLSMMEKSYENCFQMLKSKILIYVDCDKDWKDFLPYENVVIIGNISKLSGIELESKMTMPIPQLEELDEKSLKSFFDKVIGIQNHSIQLNDIKNIVSSEQSVSKDFLNNLLQKFSENTEVTFGTPLPTNGHFYIMRYFTNTETTSLKDKDIIDNFENVIIEGDPGMGKSSTLLELALIFKQNNPHYWVSLVSLNYMTKVFNQMDSDITKETAAKFLLNYLIYCPSNPDLCRLLMRNYLAQEEIIPIVLFLDGYDEIYPRYSEVVKNLVQILSEMNVRIFITTRSHCIPDLEALDNFSVIQMRLFEMSDRDDFIKNYITTYYFADLAGAGDLLDTINEKVLSNPNFDEKFLGTPMLLKIVVDIYLQSPYYVETTEELNVFKIYDRMFELLFDNYYNKENIDTTLNTVTDKRVLQIKNIKDIYAGLAIQELKMSQLVPYDSVEYSKTEMIARGFMTKSRDGGLEFIHRTFAEYFVAEAIVNQITRKNFTLMKYIVDKSQEQIPQFVYLSLLDKMERMLLMFESVETLNELSLIFKSIFFDRKITRSKDLGIVLNYLGQSLTESEVLDFLTFQLKTCRHFTKDHIDILMSFTDEHYKKPITDSILSLLTSKNFVSDDNYFLTEFQNLLISRNLQNEKESFDKIYADMESQYLADASFSLSNLWKKNQNYTKETHFSMFRNRSDTIVDEVSCKMFTKYETRDDFETHDIVLVNYLVLYVEESSDFLPNLLTFFYNSGSLIEFLESLSRRLFDIECETIGSVNPLKLKDYSEEDCRNFLKMSLKIMKEKKWEMEKFKGKSLLHYSWDKLLLKYLLDDFPTETIRKLTSVPHFDGMSAIDYYASCEDNYEFPIAYLEYLYKTGEKEEIMKAIQPHKAKNSTCLLQKNLNIYFKAYCSFKYKVIDESLYNEITEKIVVETAKGVVESSVNVIYPFISNDDYMVTKGDFLDEFLTRLTSDPKMADIGDRKEFLLQCLNQIDEDGNNLLHKIGVQDNSDFIRYLLKHLSRVDLMSCIKVTNKKGQNYFHTLSGCFFVWKKNKYTFKKDFQDLLLTPDNEGRTPFHRHDAEFLMHFSGILTNEQMIQLIERKDNDGNNIIHWIAEAKDDCKEQFIDFRTYLTITLSTEVLKKFKEAMSEVNNEGKSPIDLGFHFKI
ncbi:hypothetical protein DMENIID0001_146950 [Sergentomyia squamirostris]